VWLFRKRVQVLGFVDAPSREVAEAAAASAFSLTDDQRKRLVGAGTGLKPSWSQADHWPDEHRLTVVVPMLPMLDPQGISSPEKATFCDAHHRRCCRSGVTSD